MGGPPTGPWRSLGASFSTGEGNRLPFDCTSINNNDITFTVSPFEVEDACFLEGNHRTISSVDLGIIGDIDHPQGDEKVVLRIYHQNADSSATGVPIFVSAPIPIVPGIQTISVPIPNIVFPDKICVSEEFLGMRQIAGDEGGPLICTRTDSGYDPPTFGIKDGGPSEGWSPSYWFPDNALYNRIANFSIRLIPEGVTERQVPPTSINAFRGSIESGGLAQVLVSDDDYLVVRNGSTANRSESPITLDANFSSPSQFVTAMQIRWENRVSITRLHQVIQMRNYANGGSFTQVDDREAASSFDNVVTVSLSDPSAFIERGTGAMVSRLLIKLAGPIFSNTWRTFIDQVIISQL